MAVSLDHVYGAAQRLGDAVVRTPCVASRTLSSQLGCEFFIKFENMQFTASFKERGALNCLLKQRARTAGGVIAMSAGNHAQALAYHGTRLGLPTTIVMPRTTPNAKVEATRLLGARVVLEGAEFDETLQITQAMAEAEGLFLVHPFDDPDVIAGQGTVALEMLDQVDELDVLVVPVGGGGLISGMATAVKALRPQVQIIGVQMERYSSAHDLFHTGVSHALLKGSTVAEGIAVKAPGELTRRIMQANLDDVALVTEQQVEQAIFDLLEIEKTVAEGAGAVGLALVRARPEQFAGQRVATVLSGGNIDMMILSSVLQRGMVRSKRLVRMQVELPDQPGALADLARLLGEMDSNIMHIEHQRAFGGSSVRTTLVELVLQMRGEEEADGLAAALSEHGYQVV